MDYRVYKFSRSELVRHFFQYGVLNGVLSWLFYRSLAAFVILLPGFWFYLRQCRAAACKSRLAALERQFLTGIQAVSNSMEAGYSVENAFKAAVAEAAKVYGAQGYITREFERIKRGLELNRPLEELLVNLAERSRADAIESFTDVFLAARKSGGDLIVIVRNTIAVISQKEETARNIEVSIAAKRMELNVMSVVPVFILLYVQATSPEFLSRLYHNRLGVLIMTVCLLIYFCAWQWGRRIVDIKI